MKHEQLSSPVVTCTEGALAGIASNGVEAFFDIPYAADLNQSQRFSLPDEPAPWQGVRDARSRVRCSRRHRAD
jgi:para-nitrobenzyl esterase